MDQAEALTKANGLFQGYGATGTTTGNNGADFWIGWRTPQGGTSKWYGENWEKSFETYFQIKDEGPPELSLEEVLRRENQLA